MLGIGLIIAGNYEHKQIEKARQDAVLEYKMHEHSGLENKVNNIYTPANY